MMTATTTSRPRRARPSGTTPQGNRFIRTGDVGRFDEDGFLTLMDRRKDMVITGGFNIYPSDLEAVLRQHPAVADAAVVGVPRREWGETPVAFVVPGAGRAGRRSDLRAWANERLGKTQRLAGLRYVDELPRSDIGKVLKRELREALGRPLSGPSSLRGPSADRAATASADALPAFDAYAPADALTRGSARRAPHARHPQASVPGAAFWSPYRRCSMKYMHKAIWQSDGNLVIRGNTRALLFRALEDVRAELAKRGEERRRSWRARCGPAGRAGVYDGRLPSATELLGDPRQGALSRNLLKG